MSIHVVGEATDDLLVSKLEVFFVYKKPGVKQRAHADILTTLLDKLVLGHSWMSLVAA